MIINDSDNDNCYSLVFNFFNWLICIRIWHYSALIPFEASTTITPLLTWIPLQDSPTHTHFRFLWRSGSGIPDWSGGSGGLCFHTGSSPSFSPFAPTHSIVWTFYIPPSPFPQWRQIDHYIVSGLHAAFCNLPLMPDQVVSGSHFPTHTHSLHLGFSPFTHTHAFAFFTLQFLPQQQWQVNSPSPLIPSLCLPPCPHCVYALYTYFTHSSYTCLHPHVCYGFVLAFTPLPFALAPYLPLVCLTAVPLHTPCACLYTFTCYCILLPLPYACLFIYTLTTSLPA